MQSARRGALGIALLAGWLLVAALLGLVAAKVLMFGALPVDMVAWLSRIDEPAPIKQVCVAIAEDSASLRSFSQSAILSAFLFVAVSSAIFLLVSTYVCRKLYRVSSATDVLPDSQALDDRVISGKLDLWKAFWVFYLVIPPSLAAALFGTLSALKGAELLVSTSAVYLLLSLLAVSAVALVYWLAAITAWRCSRNTSRKVWHYLARLTIIGFTIIPLMKSSFLIGVIFLRLSAG